MVHMPARLTIEDELGYQDIVARHQAARNFAPKDRRSWKPALALLIEIEHFIRIYGHDYCALLTLLFAAPQGNGRMTPKEAQRIFKRAARLFRRLFPAYIAVLDFHRDGAVHLHLLVALHHNIRDGWNFEADRQYRKLRDNAKREQRSLTKEELSRSRSLARQLTTNTRLKGLWKTLRVALPRFGFPRKYPFELKPVRNPVGLAKYLARRYRESHASPYRPPHSWCCRYCKGYRRCVDRQLRFEPVGESAARYRRKRAAIGVALGFDEIDGLIDMFGPPWEYCFADILQPVNPRHPTGFFSSQWAKLQTYAKSFRPDATPSIEIPMAPWTAPVPAPGPAPDLDDVDQRSSAGAQPWRSSPGNAVAATGTVPQACLSAAKAGLGNGPGACDGQTAAHPNLDHNFTHIVGALDAAVAPPPRPPDHHTASLPL